MRPKALLPNFDHLPVAAAASLSHLEVRAASPLPVRLSPPAHSAT